MGYRLLGVLLAALASAAGAQDVSSFDSAGVKLGQTLPEAEAALTGQGFTVERAMNSYRLAPERKYVQALRAERDNGTARETVVIRLDEPPSEPRVYLVWRTIAYKPGAAPTIDSYRAAVREKAGNETYFRTDQPRYEQYVQWGRNGKVRRNVWNMLASLPSSYPSPCVIGMGVRSADEALRAKVHVPESHVLNGNAPPPDLSPLAPQDYCASGLIASYAVPDRATGLVTQADMLLVDQPRMRVMAEKRDNWLEELNAARIKAARESGGKPVL